MRWSLAAVVLASVLAFPARGQDSGPGPVDPATEQTYSASFFSRRDSLEGSFTFFAGEPTETTRTSGTFESTIGEQLFTGDWRAWDLGSYAFWYASGSGETDSLFAFGFATPDNIVGRATLRGAEGGFWAFLRALFGRSYLFFGEAEVEMPPTEPMMEPT